jgi:hypothetical protein
MSHSANACLFAARHPNAALALLKQVRITLLRADTRWPNLLKNRELGPSDKRHLGVACMDAAMRRSDEGREQEAISFAALANGTTRADPMSVANAAGLTCELRLDLALIRSPEYDILSRRVNRESVPVNRQALADFSDPGAHAVNNIFIAHVIQQIADPVGQITRILLVKATRGDRR